MGLILVAVTFALMWVLFILPQQRRVRAHQALVATLKVGDEIMTTAGLYATISALDEETVRLEVAPGVELTYAKGAVARTVGPEPEPEPEVEAEAETPSDDEAISEDATGEA